MPILLQLDYYLFALTILVLAFIIFGVFVACVFLFNTQRQHEAVMDKLDKIIESNSATGATGLL